MNKAELIESVVKMTGQTKQQVGDCLTAVLHTVTGSIAKGERVMLVGFGTLERRNRRARVGVNPQDPRKKITIQAAKIPAFRPGQELKAICNGTQKLVAPQVGGSSSTSKSGTKKKAAAKKPTAKKAAKKRR